LNAYLPIILEIFAMLLVWLLATAASRPLRRRLHRESIGGTTAGAVLADLIGHISRPFVIILITQTSFLALSSWSPLETWRTGHETHFTGWLIFWLGVMIINLVEGAVQAFYRWRQLDFPIPDLLLDIIRSALVLAMGFLVLKVELGIDIGPLLASTALLTAVVGFALQGVLGNLLAGMSLHLVKSLRPGAWVKIDDVEGKVEMTNWRETRLRSRGGHTFILPNAKVAEAKINNFDDPTPLRAHSIEVGASYSDEPDVVIAALLAAAASVPEVRHTPTPTAMITSFRDFGINYRLMFWTTDYSRHVFIDGEVNRMVWYQFKRQGIEIPFPMSDVLLNDFMAVVYNQRRIPPSDVDVSSMVRDLGISKLVTELVLDEKGERLLSDEDLRRIAPLVHRRLYTHGETLCSQDEPGDTFWVLTSGRLQGSVVQNGRTAVTFELEPGCIVGEMSVLTGLPRSATITVVETATVLEFDTDSFGVLLGLHDALPLRLSELAAERTAANRTALEDLARRQADEGEIVLEQAGILGRLLRFVKRG